MFYLSASSADEMRSWVGMLETLKQYRRTATMHARLMNKVRAAMGVMGGGGGMMGGWMGGWIYRWVDR